MTQSCLLCFSDYYYSFVYLVLRPINSKMQMKINTKPGLDMNVPQVS